MKAVVISGPGKLEIVDKPLPVPGPGEALIKISYCGICGSDLHAFETGFFPPRLTIGHEFSGVVCSLGEGCHRPAPGRYVTGNNIIGCGRCRPCRRGRDNLCLEMHRLGITAEGTMAEYALVPVKELVELPAEASLEEAALAEPLSVGLHAVNRAPINPGDSALILGAGTIGLAVLALLKYKGVENVIVVEPAPARRAVAGKMGAARVIDPAVAGMDREVGALTGGAGADVVFECAGLPETIGEACSLGGAGASVVVLSICEQAVELNLLNLVTREINLGTAFGKTAAEFKEAADLISRGRVDLTPLITDIVPVAEVAGAFSRPSRKNIKTLVAF